MNEETLVITSLLRYHGLQAVSIGRFRVLIEYLEEVIGTRPSVSPLQDQETTNLESYLLFLFTVYGTYVEWSKVLIRILGVWVS